MTRAQQLAALILQERTREDPDVAQLIREIMADFGKTISIPSEGHARNFLNACYAAVDKGAGARELHQIVRQACTAIGIPDHE